jgi:RNA polymerase sigma-70 factor (ECF subfamily)
MGVTTNTIDAVTEAEAAADIVWAAASLLPESQRTALLLRYTHELSLVEVAETMELTVPAIKSLLQRAHRTLRERLGGVFQQL